MRENGFSVLEAQNAQEAPNILESNTVDIVLTDLEIPNTNGLQLTEAVKTRYHEIRVLLLSGWPGGDDGIALLAGAEKFFPKPLEWETLLEFLHKHNASA